MPLESLLEMVETLRERIDVHGAALRQSEALTRYALIDPLLRELGWNTEDPALVMPEYRLGRGYADYALLRDGRPMIMVEAKKLGTSLQEAATQGIGYCIEDGIAYFAVTDGKQWEIYETHKMAPIAEKLTVQFDLTHSSAETCLKALALWRPNVIGGNISVGQSPIAEIVLGRLTERPITERAITRPQIVDQSVGQPTKTAATNALVWTPLSELNPQPRSKPAEILLPDGSKEVTGSWAQLITCVTHWLYDNNKLNLSDLPIQRPGATRRYIVANIPKHPNGNDFVQPRPKGTSSLYVETGDNARKLVDNACFIIKRTGDDPAKFKARFSS